MRFGLIGCGWSADDDHLRVMLGCDKVMMAVPSQETLVLSRIRMASQPSA